MNASSSPKPDRRFVRRWLFPLAFWAWFSISWLRHDFGTADIVVGGFGLFWLGAAWLIQSRTTRPRRSFYWLALASSVVAALFMGFGVARTETILPGVIGWVGLTVLGLIWCIHFERTENIH